MQAAPVQIGEMIDGKYRVEAVLGQGAMGLVVRARHVLLDHDVAIKVLLGASDGDAERRFVREARIAGKLKSEYAARVMDTGTLGGGSLYLVMEHLRGEDLSALLARSGVLPVDVAVTYVLQACHALAEAHAAGIVHRDVKPGNLMLTADVVGEPCIKVLDFGVAKAVGTTGLGGTEENRLTATATALGSPLYMAPEQINDAAHVDARADLWSLGVTLYQLLTGATPWTGSTALALFASLATQPPVPLADLRPDVPPALASIILQCLERDRARRWPSVVAFAAALAPYGDATAAALVRRIALMHRVEPVPSERLTEPMPASVDARTAPRKREEERERATPQRARLWIGVALAVTVAVVAASLVLLGAPDAKPAAAPIAIPVPAPQPSTELAEEAPPPRILPAPSTEPASTTTPRPKPPASPAPAASPIPAERAHRPPDGWSSRH